ncbi:unnamed protein product [Brugia pahangi]|uniref:Lipoprotein n=1 Tax=Brugia pahangi TaxID=6280 RepID=A0A0N4T557_BRUPA|nr:unnamed protein product [Brugia pahangi]
MVAAAGGCKWLHGNWYSIDDYVTGDCGSSTWLQQQVAANNRAVGAS